MKTSLRNCILLDAKLLEASTGTLTALQAPPTTCKRVCALEYILGGSLHLPMSSQVLIHWNCKTKLLGQNSDGRHLLHLQRQSALIESPHQTLVLAAALSQPETDNSCSTQRIQMLTPCSTVINMVVVDTMLLGNPMLFRTAATCHVICCPQTPHLQPFAPMQVRSSVAGCTFLSSVLSTTCKGMASSGRAFGTSSG